jgi:hypothetical protein
MSDPRPILAGFDYQHLYSWWLILGLKLPDENVQKIIVENGQAGYVDDVTVHYEPGLKRADRFYQVKYRVEPKNTFTMENFQKELLEKFWSTWKKLRSANPDRQVELYLISNRAWDRKNLPERWIDSATGNIDADEFFSARDVQIVTIRHNWLSALKEIDKDTDEESFKAFISSLYLRLEYSEPILKYELIVERMQRLKLKTDLSSLETAVSIVGTWIKKGKHEITETTLDEALKDFNLPLPKEQERCVTVYLETIEKNTYPREADHPLDWTDYFIEQPNGLKGHQLKNPADWNDVLLPQLYQLNVQVKRDSCRLISTYGKSRLSAWFAFGYVFSEVAGYTIDFNMDDGTSWRTDTPASKDFSLIITSDQGSLAGEIIHGEGDTIAVGISVTARPIEADVHKYLQREQNEKIAALLLLRSEQVKLLNAGDAVALADRVKEYVSMFANEHQAKRMLLFYLGPVGGACFIGYKLNKICRGEVQIMEHQTQGNTSYAPSFLLTM